MRTLPGSSYPLGATWDGEGINFALFSENAEAVELCLFGRDGSEVERIAVIEHTDLVWHVYVPDLTPGQLYGFRVHGPWDPDNGHRFNSNKLLLDPYARSLGRGVAWSESLYDYDLLSVNSETMRMSVADSVPFAPLAAVVDDAFDWGNDAPPKTPWHETVIYEVHVKAATNLHPEVPDFIRGSYLGIGSEPFLSHLKKLGVTAVELLPVHAHLDQRFLIEKGLTNFWGYDTLAFFAPEPRYASLEGSFGPVEQFKSMVRSLHSAGIEVILDVVYNHTAEGDHLGPTLSWRGIDNAAYYRLAEDPRRYLDFTGCGNTFRMTHPRVLQLIMDSLRYWVQEMHVDGFRFDLASTLARELYEVDKLGAFFDIIHQDPIISRVKLIAEPWDVGEGGYQVGNFPVLWTEWNGKYRDCVRRFWKGAGQSVGEFATRISGSSDLYQHDGRKPYASINFVTCHDGFTLNDLVSYEQKHNEANLEENRDGLNENDSWNCGAEGPTSNPRILDLRARQQRNFIATLLLSTGVPMLHAGDELGRTLHGNNNAYCHDNELTWLSWSKANENPFLTFCQRLAELRRSHPVLRRRKYFSGKVDACGYKDISWWAADGSEMYGEDWNAEAATALGMVLSGELIDDVDSSGEPVVDKTLLVIFNPTGGQVEFILPTGNERCEWTPLLDTATELGEPPTSAEASCSGQYNLLAHSLAILERA